MKAWAEGESATAPVTASAARVLKELYDAFGREVSTDTLPKGWYTYDHRPRFGTNYFFNSTGRELAFAGHPSLGAAAAVAHRRGLVGELGLLEDLPVGRSEAERDPVQRGVAADRHDAAR